MLKTSLLCGLTLTATAFSADLHEGTWKLDASKSHYAGHSAPKSETVTVTRDGTSFHLHFDITMSDGRPMNGDLTFPRKGGPVTEKGFPPDSTVDHASVKVVNGNTWIFSYFDKDNKLTSRRVVTSDGRVTEAKLSTLDGKVLEDEFVKNNRYHADLLTLRDIAS